MKVAVVQLNATINKEQNIQKTVGFLRRAAKNKAKFILLPELFNFRGDLKNSTQVQNVAEDLNGPSLKPLKALAKEYGVIILAGSIYEKTNGSKKVYNTSCLIDTRGKISKKYQKIHLFDATFGKTKLRESDRFLAGKKIATSKVGGFNIGMSICYDVRFSWLYEKYAKLGVNVLCVPSNFTKKTGQSHWETLLRARAIETLSYVLAPNQVGTDKKGITSYGHSMIIDPWGGILKRASAVKEEIIYADLKKEHLQTVHKILPGIKK